jgi:hypothetical protein
MLYPKKRAAFYKKSNGSNVSSFSTFLSSHPTIFILDFGSTSHMVSDRSLFTQLDETKKGLINTSCGANNLKIEGKGSIRLRFNNNIVIFHNVLYVPNITANLFSLQHLLLEQCTVKFSVNHFSVFKNDDLFLDSHYHHNIPVIKLEPDTHHSNLSSAELIHKALGHVSYRRIRSKIGIPIKAPEACKSCAVVKITKALFKHQSSNASKPFEEVHLDLIGPISPLSYKNHKYILTIVDSNTCFCATIPLCAKSDIYAALTFALDVKAKKFGYYPTIIHSNRGTESTNSLFENYCNKNTIHQRFSDAYTPQQNGISKRFNRTIVDSLKTILLDSGLRQNLWSEILSATTLTLNQVPTHRIKKSPYEFFKGYSIPLNYFKPIGNPVAFLSSHKKLSKLEPRGEMGKLIGFNPELKSCQILADDGRIINSKSFDFLDFIPSASNPSELNELLIEQQSKKPIVQPVKVPEDENEEDKKINIKQEEEDKLDNTHNQSNALDSEDNSFVDAEDVVRTLTPAPEPAVGQILHD